MNAGTRMILENFVATKTISEKEAETVKNNYVKPLTAIFSTLAEKCLSAPVGSPEWNQYCEHINPAWDLLIAAEYVADGILQPVKREAYFKAADAVLSWH